MEVETVMLAMIGGRVIGDREQNFMRRWLRIRDEHCGLGSWRECLACAKRPLLPPLSLILLVPPRE